MTRADTLKEAADHFYALADLFQQLAGQDVAGPARPASPPAAYPSAAAGATYEASPFDNDLPRVAQPTGDQGSEAVCPKHRVPYHPSKNPTWQPYCPEKSDGEPNWTNKNGYCSITPKSAVAWLRQHAGVAA